LYFYFSGLLLRWEQLKNYISLCFIKRNPVSICGTDDGFKNTNHKRKISSKRRRRRKFDEFIISTRYCLRLLILLNIFGYAILLLILKAKNGLLDVV
jgi:hypothetical protein